MSREQQLAQRRRELLLRSELLRQRLGDLGHNVRTKFGGVDRGLSVVRSFGGNPLLMAGLAGLFAVWRPKGIFKWVARATLARGLIGKAVALFSASRAAGPSRRAYEERPLWDGPPRDY